MTTKTHTIQLSKVDYSGKSDRYSIVIEETIDVDNKLCYFLKEPGFRKSIITFKYKEQEVLVVFHPWDTCRLKALLKSFETLTESMSLEKAKLQNVNLTKASRTPNQEVIDIKDDSDENDDDHNQEFGKFLGMENDCITIGKFPMPCIKSNIETCAEGLSNFSKNPFPADELNDKLVDQYPLGTLAITVNDIKKFQPGVWYNDVNVNLYMKWITRVRSGDDPTSFHIFSSDYLKRILDGDTHMVATQICSGRNKIDIFELKFALFPVCYSDHWSLCVLVNPGKVGRENSFMMLLDSLGFHQVEYLSGKMIALLNELLVLSEIHGVPQFNGSNYVMHKPQGMFLVVVRVLFLFDAQYCLDVQCSSSFGNLILRIVFLY